MKYKILEDDYKILPDGTIVYRIEAITSWKIGDFDVHVGTRGGYIQDIKNLDLFDNSWVEHEAIAYGDTQISDDSFLGGFSSAKDSTIKKSRVTGGAVVVNSEILNNSNVGKDSLVKDSYLSQAHVDGDARVYNSVITGYGEVNEHAVVKDSTVESKAVVDGYSIIENCRIGNEAIVGFTKPYRIKDGTVFTAHIFEFGKVFTTTLYTDQDKESVPLHPTIYTFYVHEGSRDKKIMFSSSTNVVGNIEYFKDKEPALYDFVKGIFKA